MQHASVYLYQNVVDVYINPINSHLLETYNKVYNRNLKIVRGIDNTIELRIKNLDQRPANIGVDTYLVFNLVDHGDQQHVLQKDCLLKDVTTGIASVTLTEQELEKIEAGFYDYSLVLETREFVESGAEEYYVTQRRLTYTNTMFDVKATLEVLGSIYGTVQPSKVIKNFQYFNPKYNGNYEDPAFFISDIMNANTKVTKTLHSFQFYFGDYSGEVIIQASTEDQGATPSKWSEVDTFFADGENVIRNVTGKYTWFRIKHIPDDLPTEAEWDYSTPLPEKYTINKVLYR